MISYEDRRLRGFSVKSFGEPLTLTNRRRLSFYVYLLVVLATWCGVGAVEECDDPGFNSGFGRLTHLGEVGMVGRGGEGLGSGLDLFQITNQITKNGFETSSVVLLY